VSRIIIKGIPRYDGEYELDDDVAFNAREWRLVKKHAGYMPLTVSDGFAGHDPDLYVALAVVAMTRAGKVKREDGLEVCETLAEIPFDGATITLADDPDEDGDAEDPPALTSEPVEPSQTDSLERNLFSGGSSRKDSAPSDATLPPTTASRLVTS
jgi:hypothetical protein